MTNWLPIIVALSEDPHVRSVLAALLAGALAAYAASAKTVVVGTPTTEVGVNTNSSIEDNQTTDTPAADRGLCKRALTSITTSLRSLFSTFVPHATATPTAERGLSAQSQFDESITGAPAAAATAASRPIAAVAGVTADSSSPDSPRPGAPSNSKPKRKKPSTPAPDPAPPGPDQGASPAPGRAKRSLID